MTMMSDTNIFEKKQNGLPAIILKISFVSINERQQPISGCMGRDSQTGKEKTTISVVNLKSSLASYMLIDLVQSLCLNTA